MTTNLRQGLNIPDIDLIIQWGYVGSLCMLVQCIGHTTCGCGRTGLGLYFVEHKYFDHHKKMMNQSVSSNDQDTDEEESEGARQDPAVSMSNSSRQMGSHSLATSSHILKDPWSVPFLKSCNRST